MLYCKNIIRGNFDQAFLLNFQALQLTSWNIRKFFKLEVRKFNFPKYNELGRLLPEIKGKFRFLECKGVFRGFHFPKHKSTFLSRKYKKFFWCFRFLKFKILGWKVRGSISGNIRKAFFWENIRIFLKLDLGSPISGNIRNFFQVGFLFFWVCAGKCARWLLKPLLCPRPSSSCFQEHSHMYLGTIQICRSLNEHCYYLISAISLIWQIDAICSPFQSLNMLSFHISLKRFKLIY